MKLKCIKLIEWPNSTLLLPPANEVWGKVIFLHLFVILFTGEVYHQGDPPRKEAPPAGRPPWEGGTPQQGDPLGRSHPPAGRPPRKEAPLGRKTPPRKKAPPGRETPLGKRHPPAGRPPRRLLLRAVRILLECILVTYLLQVHPSSQTTLRLRWRRLFL